MSDSGAALEHFAEYFEAMLADITPARRKAVARKIGQQLRRSNLSRIAANLEPDGGAMEPRKPRSDRRGRIRDNAGKKMFRKLRYARNFDIKARSDGVEVRPKNGAAHIARIHHFGLPGYVGRAKDGEKIRTRYEARRLLGFGDGDVEAIADELLAWLNRD